MFHISPNWSLISQRGLTKYLSTRCELQRIQACLTLVPQSTCCRASLENMPHWSSLTCLGCLSFGFAGEYPLAKDGYRCWLRRDELQELSELGRGQCEFPNQKTPLGGPGYVCQPWNSKQEQVLGFKLLFHTGVYWNWVMQGAKAQRQVIIVAQ